MTVGGSTAPGYTVEFRHASSYDWFYTIVKYGDDVVGKKACCKSYPRAARWANRKIKSHQKGKRLLEWPLRVR